MNADYIRKVKKQRDRLFQRQVPRLMQEGDKGLKPLHKYERNDDQKVVVSIQRVQALFFKLMGEMGFVNADDYLGYLGTFLEIFRQGSEACSFDDISMTSEREIMGAENQGKIDLLTKNLISAYFKSLITEPDSVNDLLLEDGFKLLITVAGFGQDSDALVRNALERLTDSLENGKPWKACIDGINKASLVCRLLGVNLPAIAKQVLDPIILEIRKELAAHNQILGKILNATDKLYSQGLDRKKHEAVQAKLDMATEGLLEKLDQYLSHVLQLMGSVKASSAVLFGRLDTPLKDNLVRMFFDYGPPGSTGRNSLDVSKMRYRFNMLLKYESITRFCRELQHSRQHQERFLDLFRLCFQSLKQEIVVLSKQAAFDTIRFKTVCHEMKKAQDRLSLDPDALSDEKDAILDSYLVVIEKCLPEHLESLMLLNDDLVQITWDRSREVGDRLRDVLLQGCFSALSSFEIDADMDDKTLEAKLLQLIYSYSGHYKPQRYFVQIFFNSYLGRDDGSPSEHLAGFIKAKPRIARALLALFSNPRYVSELLPEKQMEIAKTLLASPALKKK
ncbi:MAG: hypothetical protein GY737_17285 [Desulfobacteraceae bacterium]|nr:hypothetical protein [Desulfobacteraceae bacterium]